MRKDLIVEDTIYMVLINMGKSIWKAILMRRQAIMTVALEEMVRKNVIKYYNFRK